MFKQRAVVVAVCALALVGCGGGGGGSSSDSETANVGTPQTEGPTDPNACPAGAATVQTSVDVQADWDQVKSELPLAALAKDTATLLVAAQLYQAYLATGLNEYGQTSTQTNDNDVVCGVFTSPGPGLTALALPSAANVFLQCSVTLAGNGANADRHAFTLTPIPTESGAQEFQVESQAVKALACGSTSTPYSASEQPFAATLFVGLNPAGVVETYELIGDLPPSFDTSITPAGFYNQGGKSTVDIEGLVQASAAGDLVSYGVVGRLAVEFAEPQENNNWNLNLSQGSLVTFDEAANTLTFEVADPAVGLPQ